MKFTIELDIGFSFLLQATLPQLAPKTEAICGGGLIFPREGQPPEMQGNRGDGLIRYPRVRRRC
jgi:hypothetical protein